MKQKRFISLLLSLCMIIGIASTSVFADTADTITVNVSIAEDGSFVTGKDGTDIAHKSITVSDLDENDSYTVDEVLYAAHRQYYDGGAAAGYASAQTAYGLSLVKLWGDDSGAFGYYINNHSAASLADTVADGDSVYAFIYQDKIGWSDAYAYFDSNIIYATKGQPLSVKLNKLGYDNNWNTVILPASDAVITINANSTQYKTNSDGIAEITFENTGVYLLSATADYTITPPISIVTVTENSTTTPPVDDTEKPGTPSSPDTEKKDYNVVIPNALEKISASYKNSTNDWIVMDMGAYENYAPQSQNKLTDSAKQEYINSAIQTVNNPAATSAEIAKAILALSSIGKNPELLYPANSNNATSAIEKLNNTDENVIVYSAPYVLCAYNQGDYGTQEYENALINTILTEIRDTNSYVRSDADTLGSILAALSFYKDRADIALTIDEILTLLSQLQNDTGAFSNNSNSTAMAIIGLCAAGIDLKTDSRFIKNENTAIDGLLSFLTADNSGFGWQDNSASNPLATEQSFRALIAFMQTVKTQAAYNVYDFSENELTPARSSGSSSSSSAPLPSGDDITVTLTIKADTGYWIRSYRVTLPGDNATVYHAFIKACDANSVTYDIYEGNYVKSITKANKTLSEFDKGINSGWLYKVNDVVPPKAFTDCGISNGDTIVWYYTEDWTKDPSAGGGSLSYPVKKNEQTQDIGIDEIIKDTANYIYKTVNNPQPSAIGGEWAVLGLSRSDTDIPAEYFDKYYQNLENTLTEKKGILHDKKYTEYSRAIIALTAIGKSPASVSGYNLLTPLSDYDKTVWQGINGAIFALIALDSGAYLTDSTLKNMYIRHILNNQNADGGFSMSGDVSDVDTTAMAITALSNYQDDENVKAATEKALAFICESQLDNAGFSTCESSSQVIVALCSLGIDIKDTRFVKNGKTVLDSLLSYYSQGNGFKHLSSDNKTNLMATEQALYALAALERMNKNKTSLYDMSDVNTNTDTADEQIGLAGKNDAVKKLAVINKGRTFADIADSAERTKIEALAERGIISGRTDSEFAPLKNMTRAEFTAIVTKSLGLDLGGENKFIDVLNNSWYENYIATAYKYGIISGISDTEFNPESIITKEEAAVMVRKAAKLCGLDKSYDRDAARNILAAFVDYTQIKDWAYESLAFCYDNKILPDSDMNIYPQKAVTREEIASMLYNMMLCAKLL